MSGPIGSDYPGNLVTSVFACFFLILSAKSALSAYSFADVQIVPNIQSSKMPTSRRRMDALYPQKRVGGRLLLRTGVYTHNPVNGKGGPPARLRQQGKHPREAS